MGLIANVKALWSLNTFWKKLKENIAMSNHNYFSTEFMSKIVTQLVILCGALNGLIPANVALVAMASLTSLYMVLRTIYKIKNPGQDLPELPVTK